MSPKWILSRREFLKILGLSALAARFLHLRAAIAKHVPFASFLQPSPPALVANWPLILCGPMLRRVEEQSVSVFVALASPRDVTLTLYDGNDTSGREIGKQTTSTMAFGKYLHAVVVTLSLTNEKLVGGKLYGYNLTFKGTNRPEDVASWGNAADLSPPLTGNSMNLGYETGKLPAFAYCPTDINQLKVIHASCRKPHGERDDLLPTLDDYIKARYLLPYERPHQLFLTGDQIYADDVNDLMLSMLTPFGDMLLGLDSPEQLRVSGSDQPASALLPGERAQIINNEALFSTREGKSHLMSLGEFFAMYLFVWSEHVWPSKLPDFATVYPNIEKLKDIAASRDYYLRRLKFFEPVTSQIVGFRKRIGEVRRALANVPTYMIFDDHEVSDDWNLHSKNFINFRSNPLGERILINALSAYTVFQAWGNNPAYFQTGQPGKRLLDLISSRSLNHSTLPDGTIIYDELKRLLIPNLDEGYSIQWDYVIEAPSHRAIVLDTRTRRDFVKKTQESIDPPNLMSVDEIQRQIPQLPLSTKFLVTLLISPPPVFGLPLMERFVQQKLAPETADRETWAVEGRPEIFEELLKQLAPLERVVILSGDVHYAFSIEVKYQNRRTTPQKTSAFVQLVASSLKNEDTKTRDVLSKGKWLTPLSRAFPFISAILKAIYGSGIVAPDTDEPLAVKQVLAGRQEGNKIAVRHIKLQNLDREEWQWSYISEFCVDTRTAVIRNAAPVSDPVSKNVQVAQTHPAPVSDPVSKNVQVAQTHRRSAIGNQMRAIVGHNNLGVVMFNYDSLSQNCNVVHKIYFSNEEEQVPASYTRHIASLNLSQSYKSKPLPDLSAWADLISFIPHRDAQKYFRGLFGNLVNWYFHRIDRAIDDEINLDYYPILITKLPEYLPDGRISPDIQAVFDYWRHHFTEYLDEKSATFMPYKDKAGTVNETSHWTSSNPLGTVCRFDIPLLLGVSEGASVVMTSHQSALWIFSTVRTPEDEDHPVSGNRAFGYNILPNNQYILFTMGADRVTSFKYTANTKAVFEGAEKLWLSLQQKLVADLIKRNKGEAEILFDQTFSQRFQWDQIARRYFNANPEEWLP